MINDFQYKAIKEYVDNLLTIFHVTEWWVEIQREYHNRESLATITSMDDYKKATISFNRRFFDNDSVFLTPTARSKHLIHEVTHIITRDLSYVASANTIQHYLPTAVREMIASDAVTMEERTVDHIVAIMAPFIIRAIGVLNIEEDS